MRRHGQRGALVVLDIDHFKPVNDTFGHAAGDELLCWFAQTLEQAVRPADAVGRLGGDEFAAIFPLTSAMRRRMAGVDRIVQALAERAPASLGLAAFPDDGTTLEELTRCADARLYSSRRGRSDSGEELPATGAPRPAERGSQELAAGSGHSVGTADFWRAALDAIHTRTPHPAQTHDEATLHAVLLDQIDASVICTDMAGTVISWNSGAEALFGWSAEEAVGRNQRARRSRGRQRRRTPAQQAERRRSLGRRAARASQGSLAVHRLRAPTAWSSTRQVRPPESSASPSTSPLASPRRPSCCSRATTPRRSPNAWARVCSRPIWRVA